MYKLAPFNNQKAFELQALLKYITSRQDADKKPIKFEADAETRWRIIANLRHLTEYLTAVQEQNTEAIFAACGVHILDDKDLTLLNKAQPALREIAKQLVPPDVINKLKPIRDKDLQPEKNNLFAELAGLYPLIYSEEDIANQS